MQRNFLSLSCLIHIHRLLTRVENNQIKDINWIRTIQWRVSNFNLNDDFSSLMMTFENNDIVF